MKSARLTFLVVTTGLMVSHLSYPQTAPPRQATQPDSLDIAMASLVSTNRRSRLENAAILDELRVHVVSNLLAILDSTNSAEAKVDAVIVLGQYRAAEAVPILLRHLDLDGLYPNPNRSFIARRNTREQLLEMGDTVSDALASIGVPAIPELLDRIAETDQTNIAAKCVKICFIIEGRDTTQFRLQRLLGSATEQKAKDRIQAAIDILKGFGFMGMGLAGMAERLPGVAGTDDTNQNLTLLSASRSVEGSAMTRFKLQGLLDKESDQKRRDRIQSAMEALDKLK